MSTKTSIKRIALVAVSTLGFGLLSVAPSRADAANFAVDGLTITNATETFAVDTAASEAFSGTPDGALDAAEADTLKVAVSMTVPNGSAVAVGDKNGDGTANDPIVTSTGFDDVFASATQSSGTYTATTATDGNDTVADNESIVLGTISFTPDVPGLYVVTLTGRNAANNASSGSSITYTVYATPDSSLTTSLTATQTSVSGISTQGNTITVTRNATGVADDGQILGAFTVTADASDAPLSDVYGKTAAAVNAVTAGGSALTPTFTVARTDLTAGSYTMRFWVDANSNGTYESSETSTTISFDVAGALDAISVSINNPIRSNVDGHQAFTVTATVTDADGLASGGTVYVSESNSTGTADATTTYTNITNDTALARVGTTNTYVGTFAIDTNAAAATGSNLVYISVANAADLTASTTIVGVASIRLVRFADLAASGTVMEAFDAVGIGKYTSGVRDALTATADADGAITVDTAITSITYTGTAAASQAGEYIYLSTTPKVGNTSTCAPSAGSYVPVLADLSFTYTVATTCVDAEGYTATFTGTNNAAIVVTFDDPTPAITTAPAGSYTALIGSSNSITATLSDQFGRALASKAITATVTGRNPATVSLTTDASGMATWSGTDSYTGLLTTDTVTFSYNYTNTAGTNSTASSTARVITYAATLAAVGSVTVVENSDNSEDIDQVQAAGIPATTVTYTATVKNATGAPIGAGVLVTCSGNADDKFYGSASGVTTSTGNGQVAVSVYRQKVGYSTITCSANGVSSTPSSSVFWTNTAAHARNVALTADQSVTAGNTATVTATVTDRWGNPIYGSDSVTFSISGVGRLQTGSSISSAITVNSLGQAQIQVTSNTLEIGDMTVSATITGGQELDPAGYVGSTAVTGVTAGNATASTKVTFTKSTEVSTADALLELAKAIGTGKTAEEANDAALEAIDAANAATDAANLAAEAADAATVAAEEARDAADAATAAVEALSAEVATLTAALKAQITALAKTVAKIAKKVKA